MKRIFQILLRLYPAQQRELLGEEMARVFDQAAREHRARGMLAFARFAVKELAGLMCGLAGAWRRVPPSARTLDLRNMRPPELSKRSYTTALDEVLAAQRLVTVNLNRMQDAIARGEFVEARFFSDEERSAREHLKWVRRKYRLAD